MEIIYKKLTDLKPYENNPRKNKQAVNAVAKSIRDLGFRVPLVIDTDDVIVCGHTRYEALKKLGWSDVPCIVADDLTEEQIKAFRLADNQVAEFATWDVPKLEVEIDELGVDMSQYGFMIGKAIKDTGIELDLSAFEDEEFDT
ncbi:MAG: ParB N-terminal domain-containing protein, partial [Prevotella sp.]|nr:ParB N-terminal domain-containing protein [Prevotella sp.]